MGILTTPVQESRAAMAQTFSNTALRRIFLAAAGSKMGDWAFSMASAVYVFGHGGPTAVGVLGVVRYLSIALAAPIASTLADRQDRRKVMIAADVIRFVLVVLAALVVNAGSPPVLFYVLLVLAAVVGTAFLPAERALLPSLTRQPAELIGANVVASTVDSISMFVGPAIAGFLLAIASIPVVFLFNAVSFLWSALVVLRIPRALQLDDNDIETPASAAVSSGTGHDDSVNPGNPGNPGNLVHSVGAANLPEGGDHPPDEKLLRTVTHGFRIIHGSREIRLLVGLYCAQTVVAGASLVFTVSIAFELLKLGNSGIGVLNAIVGIGGVVGGFVALMLAQRGRLATDFGYGVLLWSAPLVFLAVIPRYGMAIALMGCLGLANSIVDTNALTILQRLVPNESMGRVFGAMESALIGAMAVGSLAMPLLLHLVGLRWALTIIGGVIAMVSVVAQPKLRRLDRTALAPEGLDDLARIPLLSVLPSSVLERLAKGSTMMEVATGDPVFSEGEPGERYYMIVSGEAAVSIRGSRIRTLGAGDAFGEIALLRRIPRTASVTALSPLVLRAIESEPFVSAVTGHGGAADQAEQLLTRLLKVR